MARNTLALFGSYDDVHESNLVPLTNSYMHVKVAPLLKQDLTNLIRETQNEASFIFRKVIQALLPDLEVWAESSGGNDMQTRFKSEIYAAFCKNLTN